MNFIQLVACYVLLKMFASKSHTKSYILKRHFNDIQILCLGFLWLEKGEFMRVGDAVT